MTDSQAKRVVRADLATRVFVVVMVAMFATTAWGVVLIRHQQVQNLSTLQSARQAAIEAKRTADTIASCTTPGQPCYERAQKQTGQAVANINRVVILAAACAVGKTGTTAQIETQIQACVIDGLARQNAGGN
jgi:hypothetical protein